jgi:hypothetical protein
MNLFVKTPATLKTRFKPDEVNSSTIANNDEDILKKQERLKVKFNKFFYLIFLKFFRKKLKLLLHLVQKWHECKYKLNDEL